MSRERARAGLSGQSRLARVQCEGGVVTSDPSSSEIDRERRRRRDEEQLRARESRPHHIVTAHELDQETEDGVGEEVEDRKSTRLNSSHVAISYAVFCLKKKKK